MREQDSGGSRRGRQEEATVVELLPNAAYRLELDNRARVIAHPAPGSQTNFVRLRLRDRVLVELSPRDDTRGRIVKLLG
ncbi:MAG: translation initiation factor IF-1 [Bryobacteraceae bacterium]|nr:translation initiation factor IF-1 [Bryobacteraceae bacterium]